MTPPAPDARRRALCAALSLLAAGRLRAAGRVPARDLIVELRLVDRATVVEGEVAGGSVTIGSRGNVRGGAGVSSVASTGGSNRGVQAVRVRNGGHARMQFVQTQALVGAVAAWAGYPQAPPPWRPPPDRRPLEAAGGPAGTPSAPPATGSLPGQPQPGWPPGHSPPGWPPPQPPAAWPPGTPPGNWPPGRPPDGGPGGPPGQWPPGQWPPGSPPGDWPAGRPPGDWPPGRPPGEWHPGHPPGHWPPPPRPDPGAGGSIVTAWAELVDGFEVRPRWPGGSAPVAVEVGARRTAGAAGSNTPPPHVDVYTTVQAPLGEWVELAQVQRGSRATASTGASTVGTQRQMQLQLRVRPAD